MAKIVSDSLIPSKQNAPLDAREEVNSLAEIASIQNPSESLVFYVKETKKHYKVTSLKDETISGTSLTKKVIGGYEEFGEETLDYEELEDVTMDDVFDQEGVETLDVADAPVVDFDSLK